MIQIVLDANVAIRLYDLTQPAELCDPSGQILGQFVPRLRKVARPDGGMNVPSSTSEWEPASPDVSEAELDLREKSDTWYSSEEVIARLKSLEKA